MNIRSKGQRPRLQSHRVQKGTHSIKCPFSTYGINMFHKEVLQLTGGDVVDSKESDTNISVDVPLLCFAVRLTAVVHETRIIAFRTSIDDSTHIHRQCVNLHSECPQGGHFPVSIKFTDFSPTYYLARSSVAYFKVGNCASRTFFECTLYWGTKSLVWAPNLGYICYCEDNLIVTEKCYSWYTKGKNTFSFTFPWPLSNSQIFPGCWPPWVCHQKWSTSPSWFHHWGLQRSIGISSRHVLYYLYIINLLKKKQF